jgi:flagellar hook-associated protein 2
LSLSIASNTAGSVGDLTVTSSVLDTTKTSATTLNYTNSSDINNMSSLGISVNNDGSLTFDAASLDSVLNSDYSSVTGFFQNASGWGQSFAAMLTNAGSSSPTGVLALASSSNSSIESTLNADISREESLISAQSKSLTTELNTANQVMQELPTMLDQVNELYSAITGYNQQTNG